MAYQQLVRVTPLLNPETSTFAEHYQRGLHWFLIEQQERSGPLFDADVVETFRSWTCAGLFDDLRKTSSRQTVGFYLGTIHAGVLSPLTCQLRSDVTTLVRLQHPDAMRGYHAGRVWFFDAAELQERRYTESRLLERLRESLLEMVQWQDSEETWYFAIGCLLGELSGPLFPLRAE
ncbi:MAG TPA: hypothetical protein VFA41_03010 [Ktedonobacteraceae bacterium]|jgi:hypothetical protein|nr:hypothetical protein [Ktedonobacteraceae bacterium]